MRSELFLGDFTQRTTVGCLPTFREKYGSLLQGFSSPRKITAYPLKTGQICCLPKRRQKTAILCYLTSQDSKDLIFTRAGVRGGKLRRVRGRCGGSRRMVLVSLASVGYVAGSARYTPFCRTCKHGDLRLPHWGSL